MKHMENKYNDFCVCSPETYALIAKKYNEQLSQRNKQEEKQNINTSYILSLLQDNLTLIEGLPVAQQSYIPLIQKIYVKTYNLLTMAKKEFNISNATNIYRKTNYKQQFSPTQIKKISINNLCHILKELITCNNTKTAILTLEILECWIDI